jgi:hypothetical protein
MTKKKRAKDSEEEFTSKTNFNLFFNKKHTILLTRGF